MDKLIVSLDVDNFAKASRLIDVLSPKVNIFKVGIAPYVNFGEKLFAKLQSLDKKIFLDLKFHDIPNTVKNAAKAAAEKDVFMLNFHCLGGKKMLQAAVEGIEEVGATKKPLLIGVTILTSMETEDMEHIGLGGLVEDKVVRLAQLAKDAGLDGVVASAKEAGIIKEKIGQDFIVVTPGIRPAWSLEKTEDQKRVLTPKQAITEGADYIVVGRPIIQAKNPLAAAHKIIAEIGGNINE